MRPTTPASATPTRGFEVRVGVLPLGRATFDVPFAEATLAAMLGRLGELGHEVVGRTALATDPATSAEALAALVGERLDRVLVFQVTFTDAAFVLEAARALDAPLALWAPTEPRAGGRLRLNALCGLNLAAHALGRAGVGYGWLHADPSAPETGEALEALLEGRRDAGPLQSNREPATPLERSPLSGARVVQIGAPPDGFVTCHHDAAEIERRFGATVATLSLDTLFDTAREVASDEVTGLRQRVSAELAGLDEVDQGELDRSLRLKIALDRLRQGEGTDAFAIRCWPETFTEYGGAVCGAVSMLGEAKVPCACEADVWGALTERALQEVANAPVFLVDLVDVDAADDSAVVWHCGQAPLSMAAGEARATIHTNRKMPLLYEFPLREGRVTFFRLSQAYGRPKAVVASGTMLDRPMAFTGTSGVVRFDAPAALVLERIMNAGLEHHMALTYGDHAETLRRLAATLELEVLDLCAPEVAVA